MNQISAMVAYWDRDQRCVFSNDAYRESFGRRPAEMVGISMEVLLGSTYENDLPFIRGALAGKKQIFERRILLPGGGYRDGIATYTPDLIDGVVQGFSADVADVTALREREAALERTIRERDAALTELRTLRGFLPICAWCKSIRDTKGVWRSVDSYMSTRGPVNFTHGICPTCIAKLG